MFSFIKPYINPISLQEKTLNSLAAACAILILGYSLRISPHESLVLPLMASMGASAFLVFVVPHSPMAQPWPLINGHVVSAAIGVASGHWISNDIAAGACSVGLSLLAMQSLRCLHPPGAATALAAAMSATQTHGMVLQFLGYAVLGNAILLFLIAYAINNLLLKRRYPLHHSHHPHHAQFQQSHAQDPSQLNEDDIEWALNQMDGIVDVSKEDLIDIYELALERASARDTTSGDSAQKQRRG
jgi:CBS-domain-containing membrane protein